MTNEALTLDPKSTALVLIDLQNGVLGRPLAPHSGDDVLANSVKIADRFREIGSLVVLVHVAFSPDGADRLTQPIDAPPFNAPARADWSELVPQIGPQPGDLVVVKRQWGAFYGTNLDLQLRRRGIKTIVLGGIATNFGVESTARDAYEHNYALVLVEDAMSSLSDGAHEFAVKTIFPRLGRIRSTEEVLGALAES